MGKNKIFTITCILLILGSIGYMVCTMRIIRHRQEGVRQNISLLVKAEESTQDSLLNVLPVSRLEFEQSVVDFGDVGKDTVLTATYVARNTGQSDIIIGYVNPECICTSYQVSKTRVSPNDTLAITLTFDTKGKSRDQRLYATVRSNTREKMHKLLLKATIVDD